MIQKKIPATYMRGGTSKGVFFRDTDLPTDTAERDALLLRITGSPDPYGKQIDGMGGATSSTSKVNIISVSDHQDCDVDYLFGEVAVETPVIDYSGSCGNLIPAVGVFAITAGLVEVPADGMAVVRIWQANVGKKMAVHIPMQGGQPVELGDFTLDGVTFPASKLRVDFIDPAADDEGGLFPTGQLIETVDVPGVGAIEVTMINAGNPHIIMSPAHLGITGSELPDDLNKDKELLEKCEQIRSYCTVLMGLAKTAREATELRPHTPKLAFVADPAPYVSSSGKKIAAEDCDMSARILSMGKVHHAMTGTGGVGLTVAASIEGTMVQQVTKDAALEGRTLRIGQPSGIMAVAATTTLERDCWKVEKVSMDRCARRLMEGWVLA